MAIFEIPILAMFIFAMFSKAMMIMGIQMCGESSGDLEWSFKTLNSNGYNSNNGNWYSIFNCQCPTMIIFKIAILAMFIFASF